MKCLFVFSLLIISTITASSEDIEPRALQIAKNLEEDGAKHIAKGDREGIASKFTDDFKHKECDGTILDRAGIVEKMMERTTKTSIPEMIFIAAKMINDSQSYYVLDEKFKAGNILRTNVTCKYIGNEWKYAYGEDIDCK